MADDPEPTYEANTVEELRNELRARDLPVSGSKEELITRLEEDDAGVHVEAAKKPGDPPADGEDTGTEVDATEAEVLVDYYPVRAYSPWELPANTAAAQQYIDRGLVVDESLVPPDDVLASANNNIELYGHPDDPRLSGDSLITNPLSVDAMAAPSRVVEIEEPTYVERDYRTWGQVQEAEAEGEAEKEEAKA